MQPMASISSNTCVLLLAKLITSHIHPSFLNNGLSCPVFSCRAKIESAGRWNIRTQKQPSLKKFKACKFGNIYQTNLYRPRPSSPGPALIKILVYHARTRLSRLPLKIVDYLGTCQNRPLKSRITWFLTCFAAQQQNLNNSC